MTPDASAIAIRDALLSHGDMRDTTQAMLPWELTGVGAVLLDSPDQTALLLARQIRRRTDCVVSDLGPMRAMDRQWLIDLALTDRGFAWPLEMVLKAANAGWGIQERPVRYRPRIGLSKVTGTVRGTFRATRDMTRILRQQE